MNLHKRGKTVSPHIKDNFNCCWRGKSYSIQIIDVLSGNGNDETGIVDESICRL